MHYDWKTFALVVALHVPRSVQVSGRRWPQGGYNSAPTSLIPGRTPTSLRSSRKPGSGL
jgi:hypothetical protein